MLGRVLGWLRPPVLAGAGEREDRHHGNHEEGHLDAGRDAAVLGVVLATVLAAAAVVLAAVWRVSACYICA